MDLILASTSPYRRSLVERLGLPFRCVAPPVDEESLKLEMAGATPRELAGRLAMAKASSVAKTEPGSTVIGGDQLVAFDGSILGKPGTTDRAVDQLRAMSGRTHELITDFVVIHELRAYAHSDVSKMTLRNLTPEEIARYVDRDQPLDCAGSYKLEAGGIALFEKIECVDHSAITGIPLIALATILRAVGYPIP